MPQVPVYNSEGKETASFDLPENVFSSELRPHVVHQAVVMYLANQRQGTASTKERGSVSGGGKKPYRQKGTGRARAGSTRSPLWHGGGVVFGPHPRDFTYRVPRQVKLAALTESLKAKQTANDLLCVEELTVPSKKTKDFVKILNVLNIKGKILTILDGAHPDVRLAARNIPYVSLVRSQDVTAYDVLCHKKILITRPAFEKLLQRLQRLQ